MSVETTTTILFVDDSTVDRIRGAGLIRKARSEWNVVTVASAEDALVELSRRHVDIVVSDLMMPGLDGRQLLKIMNDDYPLIPVVLISAHGDDQMAAECIGLGAVNYVGKTRLADDLISVLSEVVLGEEEIVAMRRVLKHVVQNRCEFEIDSDLNQIRPLVNFVRERLHAMQMFSAQKVRDMTTAVRESLLNAYFHGNLQVNSRPLELSRSEYIDLAAERRNDPAYAGRHIRLMMLLEQGTMTFCIGDDGPGFDPTLIECLAEPPDERLPNGNGVRQMRMLMDSVTFNDAGNEVTLTDIVEQLSV